MKNIFLLVFIVFFSSLIKVQGQNGWVRKAKGFYSQVSVSTFSSKNYYSTDGVLFNGGSTFNSRGLLFYGEYGLTDRLTAVLDLPIVMLNSFNTTETAAGIGNARLGLKYGLLKSIPISIQIDVDIPTDDGLKFVNTKERNSLGFFEQINLPTSDGEVNFWTTLAASQSFNKGKSFGSIFASVNWRTQSFSPQFQSGLEIGHLFADKFYLIGKLKIQERLTSEVGQRASFLYREGTTFTSYGLTGIYKLKEHVNIIGSFSDFSNFLVPRKNIYDGFAFSVGVALEY